MRSSGDRSLPARVPESCPLLATAFWVGIDSGLAPSVECSLHAGFSEQHRPPIFGGVDQHLYSQTPFRLIAFRFGEPPNIIAGISQCSCRRLTGQRYGPAKWTIPRHKTSLHNGIRFPGGGPKKRPQRGLRAGAVFWYAVLARHQWIICGVVFSS